MYKREGEETNDLIRLGFFFVKKENIPSDGSFVRVFVPEKKLPSPPLSVKESLYPKVHPPCFHYIIALLSSLILYGGLSLPKNKSERIRETRFPRTQICEF
jgi:hypothetical protein